MTKEEELPTIWFGGIIDMYFYLSPYFKFPINSSLFRTWCEMWKIIVQDSCWSNLIIVDALSETEMRWIWTFMIGFSLVFLTSMILTPWGHQPPFESSTVDLGQNPSKNVFSFNLEQCPSCKRSIQKTTGRRPFLFTSNSQILFLQTSSTLKLYNLLWRLLATWQRATCDCLCLLWRPKTSAPQHHLLWRDPRQRCCNICSLRQGLEHSTLPWHRPGQPMDGRALQDCLCIWPAWPLSCQPASPAPPQQRCQHVPNALDTSVKRLDKPWSSTCSSKESWS